MGQTPSIITPPKMLDELRALPRPVWLLFAGTFVNKFGTFVMPFLALYLTKTGYSSANAGFSTGNTSSSTNLPML